MAHLLRGFMFIVALSVCDDQSSSAQTMPATADRADAPHALRTPPIQDPQELQRALLEDNPAEAVHLFWRFGCASNLEAAEVVRQAWELRDSAGSTGATRDPVVLAQMAKCLAAAWPRFRPTEPDDAPVLAQLRRSMASSNPEEVRAAAFGLTQIATPEDVQSMVTAAERLPTLASQMTADLSQVCRVDAIEAARAISASVTDARQRAAIDNIEAHTATTRRLLCGFDANIVGSAVSQADIDDFWVPAHQGPKPSASDIGSVLRSTNTHEAREMLWRLRCQPSEKDSLELIHAAWQTRNSSAPDSVTRDLDVRVGMAVCLANASAASKSAIDASIVKVLRQAVSSSDPRNFIAGVEGLSRIATAADVRLTENELQGRAPTFSGIAVANLTRSCAPGAMDAVAEIRERVSKPVVRRDIDYQIAVTQRVREFICAKRKGGGH